MIDATKLGNSRLTQNLFYCACFYIMKLITAEGGTCLKKHDIKCDSISKTTGHKVEWNNLPLELKLCECHKCYGRLVIHGGIKS